MNTKMDDAEGAASEMIAAYLDHIAHLDMSLTAKIELVSALQQIMSSFVDSAFGDDPTQHVHEIQEEGEKRIPPMIPSQDKSPRSTARLSSAFVSSASGKRKKERS